MLIANVMCTQESNILNSNKDNPENMDVNSAVSKTLIASRTGITDNSYVLFNDYRVQKKSIGRGSFCKVYKGYDTIKKEYVAIKKIDINKIKKSRISYSKNTNKLIELINNETKILESLDHVNIAKCHRVIRSVTNDNVYIIMEYCEGGTLKEYKKSNKMNINCVIRQIINGIDYLHKNGIIHRDLKPENIMFKNNVPKIIDFGFAKKYTSTTDMFQTLCGTPLYFAPEIIHDKKYTTKADIWALGVIIYELVFDRYPFLINNQYPMDIHTLNKVFQRNKIDYTSTNRNIDAHCIDLIKNMLQVQPANRIKWETLICHPYFTATTAPFTELPPLSNTPNHHENKPTSPDSIKSLLLSDNINTQYVLDSLDDVLIEGYNNPPAKTELHSKKSMYESIHKTTIAKSSMFETIALKQSQTLELHDLKDSDVSLGAKKISVQNILGDTVIIDDYVNLKDEDSYGSATSIPIAIKCTTKHTNLYDSTTLKKNKSYSQSVYGYITFGIEYVKSFSPAK